MPKSNLPLILVTDRWRAEAIAVLDAMGKGSRAKCARAVGCSHPSLTQILGGKVAHSTLVIPISRHLGIDYPDAPISDLELDQVQQLAKKLTPKMREKLLSLLETLVEELD